MQTGCSLWSPVTVYTLMFTSSSIADGLAPVLKPFSAVHTGLLMHSRGAIVQVINTSLLSDAQHIEQMNRQFHPSQRGQSVPDPTPAADGLNQVQAGSGSLSAGDPLTGMPLKTEASHLVQAASGG